MNRNSNRTASRRSDRGGGCGNLSVLGIVLCVVISLSVPAIVMSAVALVRVGHPDAAASNDGASVDSFSAQEIEELVAEMLAESEAGGQPLSAQLITEVLDSMETLADEIDDVETIKEQLLDALATASSSSSSSPGQPATDNGNCDPKLGCYIGFVRGARNVLVGIGQTNTDLKGFKERVLDVPFGQHVPNAPSSASVDGPTSDELKAMKKARTLFRNKNGGKPPTPDVVTLYTTFKRDAYWEGMGFNNKDDQGQVLPGFRPDSREFITLNNEPSLPYYDTPYGYPKNTNARFTWLSEPLRFNNFAMPNERQGDVQCLPELLDVFPCSDISIGVFTRLDGGLDDCLLAALAEGECGPSVADDVSVCQELRQNTTCGDARIADFALRRGIQGLKDLAPRNVYLRWNYELEISGVPAEYVRGSFQHVHNVIAEEGAQDTVALVWQIASILYTSAGDGASSLAQFYPGDQYVDWLGTSVFILDNQRQQGGSQGLFPDFGPDAVSGRDVILSMAHDKNKPVQFSEAAPWGYYAYPYFERSCVQCGNFTANGFEPFGVLPPVDERPITGSDIFEEWYEGVFELIEQNDDVVRQVNFISTIWYNAGSAFQWGDGRIYDFWAGVERFYLATRTPPYLNTGMCHRYTEANQPLPPPPAPFSLRYDGDSKGEAFSRLSFFKSAEDAGLVPVTDFDATTNNRIIRLHVEVDDALSDDALNFCTQLIGLWSKQEDDGSISRWVIIAPARTDPAVGNQFVCTLFTAAGEFEFGCPFFGDGAQNGGRDNFGIYWDLDQQLFDIDLTGEKRIVFPQHPINEHGSPTIEFFLDWFCGAEDRLTDFFHIDRFGDLPAGFSGPRDYFVKGLTVADSLTDLGFNNPFIPCNRLGDRGTNYRQTCVENAAQLAQSQSLSVQSTSTLEVQSIPQQAETEQQRIERMQERARQLLLEAASKDQETRENIASNGGSIENYGF